MLASDDPRVLCASTSIRLLGNHSLWGGGGGAGMAQWWRSGESTRFPPMCPGFDSRTRRYIWVKFVVGSRPCAEGFFPGFPVFLPSQKSARLNSNSIWKQWMKWHSVEMPLQFPITIIIILFVKNLNFTIITYEIKG